MALLQPLPDVYVPAFEMTVGNRKLETSIAKSIMEITVTEHLSGPNSFSFRLNDPKLALIDEKKGPFTEGTRVEIDLGFVGKTRKMIVGEISALSCRSAQQWCGSSWKSRDSIGFTGYIAALSYRQFGGESPDVGLRDSEIVSQIAAEMQLQPIVEETPARASPRIQNNITNLEFLQKLAQENDYFVKVDSGTIYFGSRPPQRPDTIRLEWGRLS